MNIRYILITIISIILVSLMQWFNVLENLELKSVDQRFSIRDNIFKKSEVVSDIVIIGIDDKSIKDTDEPFILWDTFFAEIIHQVVAQAPKVIGFDIIWSKSIDQFLPRPGNQKNALRKALLFAVNKYKVPVVVGVAGGIKKSTENEQLSIDASLPMKHFGLILGKQGFGVINTHPDSDNHIRRVKSLFTNSLSGKNIPSFSYLISAKVLESSKNTISTDKIKPPSTVHWINYQLNMVPPVFSFREVLLKARAGDTDYFRHNFANKVVLFAIHNVSDDIYATPLGEERSGIYIHAHTINNYLSNNYLIPMSSNATYLLILLAAIITAILAIKLRLLLAISVLIILSLSYIIATILAFNSNIILPVTPMIMIMILTFINLFIYRFTVEDKSKRRLAHFFRSYVNDQVVDDILRSDAPIKLEGSREEICVLFSDIRNFTHYSESHKPEVVVHALNQYFSVMTEVILKHGGTVDKFIGDGLMAFFGAPVKSVKNPSLNALQAALEMRQELQKLNEQWRMEGKSQLDNGIGIHTGEAIVGNIGSTKKLDYTAIGDTVNLSSRIEGLTKTLNTPILMSAQTYKEVKNFVDADSMGEVPIKGHSKIEVFKVNNILNH